MTQESRGEREMVAVTLAALGEPLEALAWLAHQGFGAVQLSAAQPGLRPRELDSTARRGLRERLQRLEIAPSGIDLWIPPEHFEDPTQSPRAVDAFHAALSLAEFLGRVPVSSALPRAPAAAEARASIVEEAARRGVRLADFADDAAVEGPVGIGLDQSRCLAKGVAPVESIVRAGAGLAAVRLGALASDGRSAPIARGTTAALELVELRLALEIGGFRGLPVIDARTWHDPRLGAVATLDSWRGAAPPTAR